jgi:hypothetical protein
MTCLAGWHTALGYLRIAIGPSTQLRRRMEPAPDGLRFMEYGMTLSSVVTRIPRALLVCSGRRAAAKV